MENKEKVNKEKEIIYIDLNESSNAKEFISGDLVHQREFDRATRLIDQRINKASLSSTKDKDDNSRKRYNDTISILGSRGSGKTSFLLSLLKFYKEKKDENNKKVVEVLDIIDPTLIEEKGHIFLTIISLIQEKVCRKMDLNECSPNDAYYCRKKEWDDMLRKLADGLPSIDGVGQGLTDTNWQDAEYIMGRGLKSVKSATNLEANFNELVSCALKTLEKEAFIIALDDIDVDFRKGWPVLETIRKYLTSPQIIVLLSGDLKLYSKAIRKQQWKNFGKALLKNEAESFNSGDTVALSKKRAYNDLVTEMEGQYLQKVIKPENRIQLTTIYEKITLYKQTIKLKGTIFDNIDIRSFYINILSNLGIRNENQAESYASFLLNLPIRTQIQFLKEFEELKILDSTNVTDAFLSDLYEKEVDIELATNMPQMLNIIILKLLLRERCLAEAYQLQPTTDNPSLNSSLTALSFLFSKQVKNNPYLIFDYIVKIGYMRNLLADIDYEKDSDKPYSIEELSKSSGIFQDKILRDVAGNITAYSKGIIRFRGNNTQQSYAGIIELKGLANKARRKNANRIDEIFNQDNDEQNIAFFPISVSINNWNNTSIVSASIFVLLATIGELTRRGLKRKETERYEGKDESNLKRERDIASVILELSQIRSYLMPDFKKSETKNEQSSIKGENWDEDEEYESNENNSNITSHLPKYLREWIDRYPENGIAASPHLLGKIVTRFFYALDGIQNSTKYDNLGDYFYRMIIALANSIIIEETKEVASKFDKSMFINANRLKYRNLNLNNTRTSDSIFHKNIFIADEYKDQMHLSTWLLSCPLFILYLPNTGDDLVKKTKNLYIQFIRGSYKSEDIQPDEIWNKSIYKQLYKVITQTTDENEFNVKRGLAVLTPKKDAQPEFESSLNTITILISKNISFNVFKTTYNKLGKQNNRTRNSKVRKACSTIFNEKSITDNSINEFVRFVNGDKSEIVNQWKQRQS